MENQTTNYQNANLGIPPQNYMTLAIIATILGCCSFFGLGFIAGLVAIYFASQVNPRFRAGDAVGAARNSKYARILSFVAIGLMVAYMLYMIYVYVAQPEVFMESQERAREMMEQWGMEVPE